MEAVGASVEEEASFRGSHLPIYLCLEVVDWSLGFEANFEILLEVKYQQAEECSEELFEGYEDQVLMKALDFYCDRGVEHVGA